MSNFVPVKTSFYFGQSSSRIAVYILKTQTTCEKHHFTEATRILDICMSVHSREHQMKIANQAVSLARKYQLHLSLEVRVVSIAASIARLKMAVLLLAVWTSRQHLSISSWTVDNVSLSFRISLNVNWLG